ncbi:1643_t:CDS:2 [Gigaspora rosea]|nr:1643_t:CDS:2 [Gigaspora rosea]
MITAIEKGQKREKAQLLFDKYKKASTNTCYKYENEWRGFRSLSSSIIQDFESSHKPALQHRQSSSLAGGSRPDYILARKWKDERKQVYVVQQTYTAVNYGNAESIYVTNNNGTMTDKTNKIKRIKSNRQSTPEDQIRPSLIFPRVEVNVIKDKLARQQEQITVKYDEEPF